MNLPLTETDLGCLNRAEFDEIWPQLGRIVRTIVQAKERELKKRHEQRYYPQTWRSYERVGEEQET